MRKITVCLVMVMFIVSILATAVIVQPGDQNNPTQPSPKSNILAGTGGSPPTLTDFWNGNAYFERSHYVTLNSGSIKFDEAMPFPNPGTSGTGPNTVYTYYRMHVRQDGSSLAHDGIGVAISNDGGATYTWPPNLAEPIIPQPASGCEWDGGGQYMPSVVKVGSTFFMVFEGGNFNNNCITNLTFGEIGLATSTDGLSWSLYNGNGNNGNGLFLTHNSASSSFECNNIGGPSVNYFHGQFYIFFHGNCGYTPLLSSIISTCKIAGFPSPLCLGATPCLPNVSFHCPQLSVLDPIVGFRLDNLRNKIGMVQATGTDLTALQSTLQSSVNSATPILDIGVGPQSWDSRTTGRPNVIWDGSYYYMFYEGSQYTYLTTYNGFLHPEFNEGNWGWGVARTADINSGSWQRYPYNPIQQAFQYQGSVQQAYGYQLNGQTRVYVWSSFLPSGLSDVLLWGTDPYFHFYPAINGGQGQCELHHKIGYVDGDGWAQNTGFLIFPNRLCYGPYQSFAPAGQYSQGIPAGDYGVTFENMIGSTDCRSHGCNPVMFQDITYNNGNNQASNMQIYRTDFQAGNSYQDFEQQFSPIASASCPSGQTCSYEWRTDWDASAYTRLHYFFLRQLIDQSNPTNAQIDTTPPTAYMNSLPADSAQSFTVSWGGGDSGTGIWSYDVQFNDNNGAWQNLASTPGAACCIGTTQTSYNFQGQCQHTYNFQVLARDNSGNTMASYSPSVGTYIPCDFTMTNSPSSISQQSGSSPATTTLTITPSTTFTGSVSLTASGAPTGLTVSFNPNPVNLQPGGSASSTITYTSASNTTPGTYTITISATSSGGTTQTLTVSDTIFVGVSYVPYETFSQTGGASGSYLIALVNTPVSVSVTVTSVGTVTGTVSAEIRRDVVNYFDNTFTTISNTVTLNQGQSFTLIGSFTPTDLTCTNTFCVRSYFVKVFWNGFVIYDPTDPNTRENVKTVSADFAAIGNPLPIPVPVGTTATSTVFLDSRNNFAGTVTLSASSNGPAVSIVSPVNVPAGGSIGPTLTITAGSTVGNYQVVVTGTSGSLVRSVTVTIQVVDFLPVPIPSIVNIQQGASGHSIIYLHPLNGFSGTVTITETLPSGFTASLNATSPAVGPNTPAVFLTLNVGSSVTIGNYTVIVYETYGGLQHSTLITVQVSNFGFAISPSNASALRGGSVSAFFTVSSINGYSGPVSFNVTSIPSCVSYSISLSSEEIPAWGTNSSTLFLYPSLSCVSSNNSLNVQASSGTLVLNTALGLTITDFGISVAPSSASLTLASSSTSSTITISSINGYSAGTSLTVSSSPGGLVVSIWPTSVTPPASSTATSRLSASAGGATPGTYTITITGTSGSIIHTATMSITVTGDFSATPSSISVQQGSSRTSTVTLNSLNGFSGTVSTGSSATLTINAVDVDDGYYRAFGLTIDQTLYTPDFWNQQPSSVIGTASGVFNYPNTYNLPQGSHYFEFGVSAWVGHWHVKIYINNVLTADVDSNVMTHVHVAFQVGGNSVSPNVANGPTISFNPTSVSLSSGGTATLPMTISTQSATPKGTYTFTVTLTSAGISHPVTITVKVVTAILSNNPSSSDWTILSGTWTQQSGVMDGSGNYPEIKSTSSFAADRTVTVSARSITTGPNSWNTAWIRAKYIDNNNKITVFLKTNGYVEMDFKQNGVVTYYNSAQSTGLSPTAWHTFNVIFSGNNIKVQVDGVTYFDLTNSAFGTFGASNVVLTSSSSESQFDSLTIS